MSRKAKSVRVQKHNLFSFFVVISLFVLVGFLVFQKTLQPFCANSISCQASFSLKVENGAVGEFMGQKVVPPSVDIAQAPPKDVLGEATAVGEKRIEVDLSNQTLTAYQGDSIFMQVPVSTGKWHITPTGTFTIWEKIKATRMTGGQGADYYNLPNVPWVMFYGGDGVGDGEGFSLHGAYWHDNFGHPMSHGCVNMRIIDAEKLYYWANPRSDSDPTKITIYGQTPT